MTKVNLFHEESTFDAKVDFPEAPQIGDSVNILKFLPHNSEQREHVSKYLQEKNQDSTMKVIERTWSTDINGTCLIIELGKKYIKV